MFALFKFMMQGLGLPTI